MAEVQNQLFYHILRVDNNEGWTNEHAGEWQIELIANPFGNIRKSFSVGIGVSPF